MTNNTGNIHDAANKVLEEAKGKFENVAIVGVTPDGKIDVATTIPSYIALHHLFNRMIFELIVHERLAEQANQAKTTPEEEKVAE